MFCRSLFVLLSSFVLFLLAIVLSVLRFMILIAPFGIFKLFLQRNLKPNCTYIFMVKRVRTFLHIYIYRFKLGGEVSWLEKDSVHTTRKRKERRAKKERKEKRRSRLNKSYADLSNCSIYFIKNVILWTEIIYFKIKMSIVYFILSELMFSLWLKKKW